MIAKFVASKFSGYIAIAAVVLVLGLVAYIYNEGKKACANAVVNVEIDLMEKRNAIANQRPDTTVIVNRLRDGTF